MSETSQMIEAMKSKFNAQAAAGVNIVFQFKVEDAGNYSLIVKDGTCEVEEGENPNADVTLIMDAETFKGISSGEINGMQAFTSGKLRTEGNMMLAMKLSELFPV